LDLLGAAYAPVASVVCATVADRAREEVGKYREVTPIPLSDDPLKWWCKHEGVYPLLSLQAKRYLCVPGTSVPAERIFSTERDIITAQRSCLLPEHVDQLLFLQKKITFSNEAVLLYFEPTIGRVQVLVLCESVIYGCIHL